MRALVIASLLTACTATIPEGQLVCDDDGDCPPDWSCSAARCYSTPRDAGRDAGSDAGMSDAGSDAGMDAGPRIDAGMDAGMDAGPTDAGPIDAGPPPGPVDVEASAVHSCVAYSDGTAYCWGDNEFGQLGSGAPDTTPVTMARAVEGLPSPVLQITTGGAFTCARHATSVSCWGRNNAGQIGNGATTITENRPAMVGLPPGDPPIDISAGADFACAVLMSGEVRCWGQDSVGQLGRTPSAPSRLPVVVNGVPAAAQISAGAAHVCARTADGRIYCWGYNFSGQLGRGFTSGLTEAVPTPAPVAGFDATTPAILVDAGVAHSCAATATAQFCWGYNQQGQLGNDTRVDSSMPVTVVSPPVSPVSQLSAGGIAFAGSHTCAIAPDATLYCWGDSADGRLGIGPPGVLTPPYPTPQETHAVMPVVDVSAGGEHTCAIANAGRVYCFGKNQRGQLGNTTTTSSNEPVAVVGLP